MMNTLRRLERLERIIKESMKAVLPFWSNDDDGFISALGLNESEKKMFQRQNPGDIGYDIVGALSFTAARDWGEGEN